MRRRGFGSVRDLDRVPSRGLIWALVLADRPAGPDGPRGHQVWRRRPPHLRLPPLRYYFISLPSALCSLVPSNLSVRLNSVSYSQLVCYCTSDTCHAFVCASFYLLDLEERQGRTQPSRSGSPPSRDNPPRQVASSSPSHLPLLTTAAK